MACDPTAMWNWLVLDFAFFLALLGGAMVLRARQAGPVAWFLFGLFSFATGTLVFVGTSLAQRDFQTGLSGLAISC